MRGERTARAHLSPHRGVGERQPVVVVGASVVSGAVGVGVSVVWSSWPSGAGLITAVEREPLVDELGDPLRHVGRPLGRLGFVEAPGLDGGVDAFLSGSNHRVDHGLRLDVVGLGDLGERLAAAERVDERLDVDPDRLGGLLDSGPATEPAAERSTVVAEAGASLGPRRLEGLLDRVDLGLRQRAVLDEPAQCLVDPAPVVIILGERRHGQGEQGAGSDHGCAPNQQATASLASVTIRRLVWIGHDESVKRAT